MDRLSQPGNNYAWSLYPVAGPTWAFRGNNAASPVTILPRRVHTEQTVCWLRQLMQPGVMGAGAFGTFAVQYPILLLRVLLEVHPIAARAISNELAIGFGLGGQRMEVIKDYQGGAGTVDDSETAYVNRLWQRHPSGSLNGLLATAAMIYDSDGWNLWEVVTGGDGVEEIYDVDSMSCYWGAQPPKRRGRPASRRGYSATNALYQRSSWIAGNGDGSNHRGTGTLGDRELPIDPQDGTVFSAAWRARSDNPYGVPRLSAALQEILSDMGDEKDLAAWFHRLGYPFVNYSVELDSLLALIKENAATELIDSEGKTITIAQWVRNYVGATSNEITQQLAGDSAVSVGITPQVVNTNPSSALPELRRQRLTRLANGLLSPPQLLNIHDGGSLSTGASIDWDIYAEGLNGLREATFRVAEFIANRDLRARGVDMIAQIAAEPIRAADIAAYYAGLQARQSLIFDQVRAGMTSEEEASMDLTGGGLANPERAKEFFNRPAPAPAPQPKVKP